MLQIILILFITSFCLFIIALFMGLTNIRFHTKVKANQIRVACVGDSTTYGTTLPNVFYNCYPSQLQRMLGNHYHIANFGFHGKTALDRNKHSFRRTKQYRLSLNYQPNLVILMLGTNDTKPKNWTSQTNYKEHYKTLLQSYLTLESTPRIILCTPNSAYYVHGKTTGAYHYGIHETNLQSICEVVKETALEMNLELIDIHKITANHPEWYKLDGIHPNKYATSAIATAVYQKITASPLSITYFNQEK